MAVRERLIFHCDCNNFFASCECLERPELKNVPLAVAGDPEKRTGVVFAKNELAKKYGVKTTDTVWQAKRKCPGLVFVPPRHGYYREISRQVNAIYREYTDFVEPASIDESYLDLTGAPGYYGMTPRALADTLRRRVREEIGITISVGVSYNKVFAKLGSDYQKPDATTIITPENYRDLLWPLPVQDMLFVGRAAAEALSARGIETIGELAQADLQALGQCLGKGGDMLWRYANGLDEEPVHHFDHKTEIKSVSRGQTFSHDLTDEREIHAGLSPLVDEVAAELRRHHLKGRVVCLQIKAPSLRTISRQVTLAHYTFLYREIMDAAMALLRAQWPVEQGAPIRALTVGVTHLSPAEKAIEQMTLLDDPRLTGEKKAPSIQRERLEKLETTIDQIRARYGGKAITFGLEQKED